MLHGDYSNLTGNLASENVVGKAAFMFKRWMPRAFFTRFAKRTRYRSFRHKKL